MKNIIILFFLISVQILPQLKSLKGIVIDYDSKSPLQFANVMIKESSIGTSTDKHGQFLLNYNFKIYYIKRNSAKNVSNFNALD